MSNKERSDKVLWAAWGSWTHDRGLWKSTRIDLSHDQTRKTSGVLKQNERPDMPRKSGSPTIITIFVIHGRTERKEEYRLGCRRREEGENAPNKSATYKITYSEGRWPHKSNLGRLTYLCDYAILGDGDRQREGGGESELHMMIHWS